MLPYGKVIPSDVADDGEPSALSIPCKPSPAMILLKILTNVFSDNAELLQGAPCSVQIFTSKFRDEECLAIAKIVDTCLKRTE